MKINGGKRGFSLIEILIVVSILGILTVLVLLGVSTARNKAKDARIRQDTVQLRYLAEVAYDAQGASYVDWTILPEIQASKNTLLSDISENQGIGGSTLLRSTQEEEYCISASLATDPTMFYCIDATAELTTVTTACPDDPTPDGDDDPILRCPGS